MHGPINNTKSWKVMQAQSKYMKSTWFFDCGGGCGNKFAGDKKCSAYGKDINMLITLSLAKDSKMTKQYKDKAKEAYNSDKEAEYFNFENIDIRADYEQEQSREERLSNSKQYA